MEGMEADQRSFGCLHSHLPLHAMEQESCIPLRVTMCLLCRDVDSQWFYSSAYSLLLQLHLRRGKMLGFNDKNSIPLIAGIKTAKCVGCRILLLGYFLPLAFPLFVLFLRIPFKGKSLNFL